MHQRRVLAEEAPAQTAHTPHTLRGPLLLPLYARVLAPSSKTHRQLQSCVLLWR